MRSETEMTLELSDPIFANVLGSRPLMLNADEILDCLHCLRFRNQSVIQPDLDLLDVGIQGEVVSLRTPNSMAIHGDKELDVA